MATGPSRREPVTDLLGIEAESGAHLSGIEADTKSDTITADTSDTSVRSLLDTLRAPPPSELARKRRLQTNPLSGIKKGKGAAKSNPKGISVLDRMKEFGKEKLVVSSKKLFCSACREELSTKKCSIEAHVRSRKHAAAKERLQLAVKRDADIAEVLHEYDSKVHPVGEGLDESTRIYRINVVTVMLNQLRATNFEARAFRAP